MSKISVEIMKTQHERETQNNKKIMTEKKKWTNIIQTG